MGNHREEVILEAIGILSVLAGLFFGGQQPFAFHFRELAIGDVAGHLGGSDDVSGGVADRRHRQRNLQQASVFRAPHRFKMIDSLAAPYACKDVVLLGPSVARNYQRDVLADRFFCAVTENSLRGRIPRGDDALQRFADYDVIGRLDDGCQMSCDL